MKQEKDPRRIWEQMGSLPVGEWQLLVESVGDVLTEGSDLEGLDELQEAPPSVVASELQAELGHHGLEVDEAFAHRLVADESLSRAALEPAIRALGSQPALSQEIQDAIAARERMMVVDAGVVSAAALLLLVLKLRRVRVRRSSVEIDFFEVQERTLASLRSLIGG